MADRWKNRPIHKIRPHSIMVMTYCGADPHRMYARVHGISTAAPANCPACLRQEEIHKKQEQRRQEKSANG